MARLAVRAFGAGGALAAVCIAQAQTIIEPAQPARAMERMAATEPVIENGPKRLMAVGEILTIGLPSVSRVAIGNGKLIKATVVDDGQIVLLAEAAGETAMHVWLKNGRQVTYAITVQAVRHEKLLSDLTSYLQDQPSLRARVVGERIVIEGRYPDHETATKVKALAESFPQVLNLVPEKPTDADPLQLERMVQLDLKVIEVKRRALDQLGIRWANSAAGPTFATNVLGYANTPWRPATTTGFPHVNPTHPAATYLGLATQITSALSFLEQQGDAWTLAEPRLSCRSGGDSKFIAGGEIPIPVPQGNGSIGVQYKQYGVVIEFKPVADGNGNIESAIVVEVSEPDPRNSNQGFVAFTTNRAETQVALAEGEPLVIAGLLRQKVDKSGDGLPALGRIPAIGYLFGSREARTEQTELFLIVSPRVITPDAALNRTGIDKASQMEQGLSQQRTEGLPPAPLPLTRHRREPVTPAALEP